ncbi:MAG: calcium/sodium antiporter, partial [Candidatus Competibacteraceae bacterium]|nr:calcium/sodium antiporter [Candidatus Competibacteraceae bacterium]
SNILNVLLILGLAALIVPLTVSHQLIRLDVPLMIGVSLLVWLLSLDGNLGRLDGLLLVAGIIAYTAFSVIKGRQESQGGDEFEQEFGDPGRRGMAWNLGLIAAGLALLVLGASWLVDGAVMIARYFGISELIIGLTIVSVGTSLPEIAASVVASLRGERDIAVGNVVGSNLFNLLLVLGVTATVAPEGIGVAPAALYFDLPVMIAVALACLPIFFTDHRIDRWEGGLFLGYYLAYLVYLLLNSLQHDALGPFSLAMAGFVLPITVVTLLVLTIRYRRRGPVG